MNQVVDRYNRLFLALTDRSRDELGTLASTDAFAPRPSQALVDDLSKVLAGHTQVGRWVPLSEIVVGQPERDASGARISDPLLDRVRENPRN